MGERAGQLFGHYRLLHLLGQGGFADVYLGEHIHLGTQAAIKVLHTQLAGEDVNGFRNEARTIARLEHPNIVRVLDFGMEGLTPYLVMSYAPNGSLRQRHPRGTVLPLAMIVSYIRQIADALQYAHDEKLIHRDIKPENMLLDRRNTVLLSDFGIALVAQSTKMQSVQEVIGTVAYMAPEMLQGHPRPASDQYALGIVVYEWLCGDRPFHGAFTELASQHMFVPPPPLRGINPSISLDIESVVLTALSKEPAQRFGSVRAFAIALEQACLVPGVQTQQAAAQAPTIARNAGVISSSPYPLGYGALPSVPIFPPTQLATPAEIPSPSAQYVPSSNTPPASMPYATPVNAALPPTQMAAPAAPRFAPTEYAQPQLPDTGKAEAKARESAPKRSFKNVFRVSKPPLADYLFPAQTKKSRFWRNLLLIIGCSIALYLWAHVYFASVTFVQEVYPLELLLVLLISAFLGKWRGAIVVGAVVVLADILSPFLNGSQGLHVGPFLIDGNLPHLADWYASTAYIVSGVYVAAAFITGWLCERGLDRRFRTSLAIMLPMAFIVSLVGLQIIRCFTYGLYFDCSYYVEPPIRDSLGIIYAIFQSGIGYDQAIVVYCIQGLLVALALPLLWKLPRVKQQIKAQE